MPRKTYVQWLTAQRKNISEMKEPKDRLEALAQIDQARFICVNSINSWIDILTNKILLNFLPDKRINEIRDFWFATALKMADFDLEITREIQSIANKSFTPVKSGFGEAHA